jgi:predicted phage-related endonuclease
MLTPAQLEIRKTGWGGSEIGALLGVDPFAGPLDVYLRKAEGLVTPDNPDIERGTFLEQGVADWYAHRHPETSLTGPETTLRHKTRSLVLATPDRLGWLGDRHRLISIKCPRRAGDAWGDHGSQLVPERAVLQLQQEDAVLTSLGETIDPVFHLAALIEGDLRVYEVERDVELQGWLMDAGERWWAKHVATRTPPPLDGSDAGHEWLRRRFPKNLRPLQPAGIAGEILLLNLRDARAAEAKAKALVATARQFVEEAIGDADGIEGASGRVTWRARKDGVRVFKPQFTNEE